MRKFSIVACDLLILARSWALVPAGQDQAESDACDTAHARYLAALNAATHGRQANQQNAVGALAAVLGGHGAEVRFRRRQERCMRLATNALARMVSSLPFACDLPLTCLGGHGGGGVDG
jgi:hypothetical protein